MWYPFMQKNNNKRMGSKVYSEMIFRAVAAIKTKRQHEFRCMKVMFHERIVRPYVSVFTIDMNGIFYHTDNIASTSLLRTFTFVYTCRCILLALPLTQHRTSEMRLIYIRLTSSKFLCRRFWKYNKTLSENNRFG